nr:histidine kinase [uncultured Eisenbergiella sp.]
MFKSKTFRKMLISITLVCFCFYGIGLFSNLYSRRVLAKQIQDTLDSKVRFWEEQLEQEISSLLLTQSSLMDDSNLLKLHVMWDSMSSYQRNESVKQFSYRLLNIKVLHGIAGSIKTYFPERKMVISADAPILEEYEDDIFEGYEQSFLSEEGNICLTVYFPFYVNPRKDRLPHYYIRTTITPSTLQDTLSDMLGEDEGILFLMDREEGRVLASSGKKLIEDVAGTPVLNEVKQQLTGMGEAEILHVSEDGFASGCLFPRLGVWLVYCYPDRILEEPLDFFGVFTVALTVLALVLLVSYAYYAGKSFARPLEKIMQAMEDFQDKESFLIEEKNRDDRDELTVIYHRYNKIVKKTESLIRENLDSKYRVHIAELRQLQYQIQPHFLYNSIFLIYRMAQMDENETMAEYAEHLGKYYQYITRVGNSRVRVSQEIGHIENYLAIQETRFGERIRTFLGDTPDAVKDMEIMPLILQPLVENAYEHGMKDCMRNGEIRITMYYEEEIFRFTVEDNGPGISDEELARMRLKMEEGTIETEEIHAISNTNIRLKLHYGEGSGLTFENREEGGFRVTARIRLGEEQNHV